MLAQRDYLMKMLLILAEAIGRGIQRSLDAEQDPAVAADLLENALGQATEIDPSMLFSLDGTSVAGILQVSGTDPRVAEYLAHGLLLESELLARANDERRSKLRADQAYSVARAFGVELSDEPITPAELNELFERTLEPAQASRVLIDDDPSTEP